MTRSKMPFSSSVIPFSWSTHRAHHFGIFHLKMGDCLKNGFFDVFEQNRPWQPKYWFYWYMQTNQKDSPKKILLKIGKARLCEILIFRVIVISVLEFWNHFWILTIFHPGQFWIFAQNLLTVITPRKKAPISFQILN